jgi:hypothetical protein
MPLTHYEAKGFERIAQFNQARGDFLEGRHSKSDARFKASSAPAVGRKRVLVNGSYMATQCTAEQELLAKFGIVLKTVSRRG